MSDLWNTLHPTSPKSYPTVAAAEKQNLNLIQAELTIWLYFSFKEPSLGYKGILKTMLKTFSKQTVQGARSFWISKVLTGTLSKFKANPTHSWLLRNPQLAVWKWKWKMQLSVQYCSSTVSESRWLPKTSLVWVGILPCWKGSPIPAPLPADGKLMAGYG